MFLKNAIQNPRLVVKKSERKLEVFDGEKLVKTYRIVLGFAPEGDKEIEGDGKTPLGEFYVFTAILGLEESKGVPVLSVVLSSLF